MAGSAAQLQGTFFPAGIASGIVGGARPEFIQVMPELDQAVLDNVFGLGLRAQHQAGKLQQAPAKLQGGKSPI